MQYSVRAIRHSRPVSITVEAKDQMQARLQVESAGSAVMSVRPLAARRWTTRSPVFPLLQFNQSLLILLQAGLSIVEAIETLADRETRPDARQVIARLHAQLNEGLPLSTAMAAQPEVFPALLVAGVRANEQTGGLQEAIERFNHYQSRADGLKKRLIGAAIYPAMILAVGGLVIAFLLFYVVPRFAVVFEDLGDRVPLMSRLLLDWGRFLHAHTSQVLLVIAAAIVFSGWLLARPAVRAALQRVVQRLPRVGEQVRVYQLARFYRALGLLLRAGLPVVQSLDMSVDLLPSAMRPSITGARGLIQQGSSLSSAFEQFNLTTVVSRRLLRVAEQTGAMGDMLERAAAFHEEDVNQTIEWGVRLFEPLLMLAIGVVIGCVVLLMYSPIFELAGSLQ